MVFLVFGLVLEMLFQGFVVFCLEGYVYIYCVLYVLWCGWQVGSYLWIEQVYCFVVGWVVGDVFGESFLLFWLVGEMDEFFG